MKNAYITITEAMLSLRSCSGRLLQIEGKLEQGNWPPMAEVRDIRLAINAAMDQLVEVQTELPEPTKGEIIKHYHPDTVDVPAQALDPKNLMGIPTVGPAIKAHLGKPEPAFTDAILSMEEGDGRPAGWTEALALEFIAQKLDDWECGTFATDFVEGDWPAIQKEWPEFQMWLDNRHG